MKIGIVLPQGESDAPGASAWTRIRDLAIHGEAAGLDSLWVYDHLIFRGANENGDPEEDGIHEAWTILAAVAAVTSRAELGTIVLGTGFRPPALLAKMAGTLDEIAGGRLILGLGTGWHEPEYQAFGYPFDHRASRFEESLAITVPLVRGDRVTFHGEYHHTSDAVLIPPPPRPGRIPGAMRVLVAAKGERVLRLTARWADAWNTAWFALPDERYAQRLADLHAACDAEGRDPATLEVTVGLTVDCENETTMTRSGPTATLPGRDAEAIARAFDAWAAIGVGHVQVHLAPTGEQAIDTLAAARRLHRGEP